MLKQGGMRMNPWQTLAGLRTRRGLTQKKAAELLGISVGTLSNYERGKSRPTVDTVHRMEELYETSFAEMVFSNRTDVV